MVEEYRLGEKFEAVVRVLEMVKHRTRVVFAMSGVRKCWTVAEQPNDNNKDS